MHLICALLNQHADFDISCNDVIFLKRIADGWAVLWEEYYNPHSKEDTEIQNIEFNNLYLAVKCFIVLKRELKAGSETNGYYRLGYKLQTFKNLIREENENTKS